MVDRIGRGRDVGIAVVAEVIDYADVHADAVVLRDLGGARLERFDLREREDRGFIVDIGRCCHDGQHERDSQQQQHEQQRGQFLFHGVRLLT